MFKDVRQLIIKYLNELETPTMPDGSPHPDYLSEAKFLAELEYLETRDRLPEPDLPSAKKARHVTEENDRFILAWYAEKLVKLVKAGDYAAIEDFVDSVLRPMRNQITRDQNRPTGRKRNERVSVELVAENVNEWLAEGVIESSIARSLAHELDVSISTIYRRLKEAADLGLCPRIPNAN